MVTLVWALVGSVNPVQAVELAPARLIDDLTARYGYAVLGTSCVEPKPLTLPDPTNEIDVATRLKTRWRVVRDEAMPGVYRTVAAPYTDLFVESGLGMPMVRTVAVNESGRVVSELQESASAPYPKLLPPAKREDLYRPGGVRVTAQTLAELLGVPTERLPMLYWRMTATVRLDRDRPVAPTSLLAAMTGTEIAEDGTLRLHPGRLRTLAAETLRMEAAKGVRTDPATVAELPGLADSEWVEAGATIAPELNPPAAAILGAFERGRPLRLRLGAEAYEAATDEEIRSFHKEWMAIAVIPVPGLEVKFPEVRRRLDEFRVQDSAPRVAAVIINLPSGLGDVSLATPHPDR